MVSTERTRAVRVRGGGRAGAVLIAACTFAGAAAGAAGAELHADAGELLARHELRSLDGATTSLRDLRGEVVVVNFWATWCKPCRREMRALDAWNAALAGRGARVVAISVDSDAERARRFVADEALALPVFVDGPDGLAKALDLPHLPYTIVLDRDGAVASISRGATGGELAAIQRTAETLLAAPRSEPAEGDAGALIGVGRRAQ
jgi:peroxiredoxin